MSRRQWTKSTAQVLAAWFERRLHDLEQAAHRRRAASSSSGSASVNRAGDRAIRRHQRPVQWLVEHHVNVVRLAGEHGMGNLAGLIAASTNRWRAHCFTDHFLAFSRPPPSPKAQEVVASSR